MPLCLSLQEYCRPNFAYVAAFLGFFPQQYLQQLIYTQILAYLDQYDVPYLWLAFLRQGSTKGRNE